MIFMKYYYHNIWANYKTSSAWEVRLWEGVEWMAMYHDASHFGGSIYITLYNLIPQQIPMVTKQHEIIWNHHLLHLRSPFFGCLKSQRPDVVATRWGSPHGGSMFKYFGQLPSQPFTSAPGNSARWRFLKGTCGTKTSIANEKISRIIIVLHCITIHVLTVRWIWWINLEQLFLWDMLSPLGWLEQNDTTLPVTESRSGNESWQMLLCWFTQKAQIQYLGTIWRWVVCEGSTERSYPGITGVTYLPHKIKMRRLVLHGFAMFISILSWRSAH